MPISGYFITPFASAGTKTTVPDAAQGDGSVSYTEGYGIDYTLDPATNPSALNIEQDKMNELFFDITTALQNYQQHGIPPFITSAMNGGSAFSYAKYAQVINGGVAYQSIAAANTDTPPSSKWIPLNIRAQLATATTFYVATSGNDSTGTGAIGAPWATIQHAVNTIQSMYDLNGQAVVIQVADGTYAAGATITQPFVGGSCLIQGNVGTPQNCNIHTTGADCFNVSNGAQITLAGLDLAAASSGNLLVSNGGGSAIFTSNNMRYGAVSGANYHMSATNGGQIFPQFNYVVYGGGFAHFRATTNGIIICGAAALSVTGTPAFTDFVSVDYAIVACQSSVTTISGAATGVRYNVIDNGIIKTSGSGINYFPGNSAGTTATGGLYT